ncbi:thioesterase superfamily protein [Colletotrichum melonis]|uniref:Thioesterase superfamily protein n=2 Tax=Colletotrichum acutatum species complex TaxID=2707335 RepID=A0AAI9TZC0_9PEZI|nr:thioesterase superfamily protein [Colletotrichum limetticola]KAK1448708.1 thioesterase superfamily protein [Colletotrichum melonis]
MTDTDVKSHPDYKHFASIPWCARLLSQSDTSSHVVQVSQNRTVLPTRENTYVGGTLNTPDTIKAWLIIHPRPQGPDWKVDELCSLITFDHGMIGFPETAHGGVVALVMDEVTGIHIVAQRPAGTEPNKDFRTGYLNTSFRKPVPAPGTVLVRSRIARVEGRKYFVAAQLEDENGEVLATAEVLYISIKNKL